MKIFTRGLGVLDRVWKFAEGVTGLDAFDTASPVQPVADLQRAAELGAIVTYPGAAGFFQVGQDNTHVGGDTVEATIDPYAALDATWGVPDQRWVWLFRYAGSASGQTVFGASASARLAVSIAALGPALARRDFIIADWAASERGVITTDLSATFPSALTGVSTDRQIMPFPLFPGSKLTWRTIATAAVAGVIRLETLCWVGPIGVMPPGMR